MRANLLAILRDGRHIFEDMLGYDDTVIPAVENAVSGASFRPGDILTARNGKTVEIGSVTVAQADNRNKAVTSSSTKSIILLLFMAALLTSTVLNLKKDLSSPCAFRIGFVSQSMVNL